MTACAYCGRDNDAGVQVCVDCGKPFAPVLGAAPALARPASPAAERRACPFCGSPVDGRSPYCAECGRRLVAPGSGPSCSRCGASLVDASAAGGRVKFCATCGAPVPSAAPDRLQRTAPAPRTDLSIVLVLLNDAGVPLDRFERKGPDITLGRQDGDIRFPNDPYLSPLHAKISWEENRLLVRDLGSRNGTWVFLQAPHRLVDGDLLLVGAQVIRFRRLGYPGPHAPDADATKRMGSLIPPADIASLTQLRADGSARDVIQLSPGRDVQIGRERGDWIFPYDPSMSAAHAIVRSEDADFVVIDANSTNGVAIAARGDVPLAHESRILVGDKLLRVELPAS